MIKKRFNIRETAAGWQLYLDDPSKESYEKVAEGSVIRRLSDSSVEVIDYNNQKRIFFGINNGKMYSLEIPNGAVVDPLDGGFSLFYGGQYHAIVLQGDTAEIVPLGEKHNVFLSPELQAIFGCSRFYYYTSRQEKLLKVRVVVDGKVALLGVYFDVKVLSLLGRLVCRREDGYFDMFLPFLPLPVKGREGNVVERSGYGQLFVWNKQHQGWSLYDRSHRFGENSFYSLSHDCQRVQFYKITDEGVDFVAEGPFNIHKKYIEVNGVMYFLDDFNEVNFEYPIPKKSFWEKVKSWL